MNILLLGNKGQLGREIERALSPGGEGTPAPIHLEAFDLPEVDLADFDGLRQMVRRGPRARPEGRRTAGDSRFHLIINAAAYTAVDRAEREPALAMAINGTAPGVLAEEARRARAGFIHFSTDYVFDGHKSAGPQEAQGGNRPVVSGYSESDSPRPLNVYGSTKWAGEQAVERSGGAYLILRTAWVYGVNWSAVQAKAAAGNQEPSFVIKVLRWAREKETLRIVSDQISNPTWARALAGAVARIAESARTAGASKRDRVEDSAFQWLEERAGLYHLAGDGFASRLEWAQAILELDPRKEEQKVYSLLPARTTDFPAAAARPLFSALDCSKFERTFGFRLSPWPQALGQALAGAVASGL